MPHKDPERAQEYHRRYREKNAERAKEAAQRWRDENPERSRQSRRDYVARNRDQVRERQRGRIDFREVRRNEIKVALWAEQGQICYLCAEPVSLDEAVLDHDHRCCPIGSYCRFCVRGLACGNCNRMIGNAGDSPERLERVARNLRAKLAEMDERIQAKPLQPMLDGS